MTTDRLTKAPAVNVGMLIRRPAAEVFQAIADPAITSRIWYSKSSGPMTPGATLTWTWEMYGASGQVTVQEMLPDRSIRFTWSGYRPEHPTTVEFRFTPRDSGTTTYLEVTETGFTGTGDELVAFVTDSTAGFSFLLSSVKALLEHDVVLGLVPDAHPDNLVTHA